MKMKDVAKMAGVSTSTVSRVLTRPEVVKKKTRDKVMAVVEALNYKPNLVARQFRRNETKIILVVVPNITEQFFSKILKGIDAVASKNAYKVLLCDTANSVDKEMEYINLLHQKQADGMILLTARIDKEKLLDLANQFPVVLACEYIDVAKIPTVSINNVSSSREITEYLITLGHKNIAHITGCIEGIVSRDRVEGYKQALALHHINFKEAYVIEGDATIQSGYLQMKKLLNFTNPPTALFAHNDEMAIGAISAVKEQGLKVPDDIAIVGFDDLEISRIVEPQLTTINQPRFEIGKKAMELLLMRIKNETIKNEKLVLEYELIIRDSCGGKIIKNL